MLPDLSDDEEERQVRKKEKKLLNQGKLLGKKVYRGGRKGEKLAHRIAEAKRCSQQVPQTRFNDNSMTREQQKSLNTSLNIMTEGGKVSIRDTITNRSGMPEHLQTSFNQSNNNGLNRPKSRDRSFSREIKRELCSSGNPLRPKIRPKEDGPSSKTSLEFRGPNLQSVNTAFPYPGQILSKQPSQNRPNGPDDRSPTFRIQQKQRMKSANLRTNNRGFGRAQGLTEMNSNYDLRQNPLNSRIVGPRGISSQALMYKRIKHQSPQNEKTLQEHTMVSPGATTYLTSVQNYKSREIYVANYNSQQSAGSQTRVDKNLKPYYSRGGLLSGGPISSKMHSKGTLPDPAIIGPRQQMRRPTTAVVAGANKNQRNRRRLASNSILNKNCQVRSSQRQYKYTRRQTHQVLSSRRGEQTPLDIQTNARLPASLVQSNEEDILTQQQYYNSQIDAGMLVDGESVRVNQFVDTGLQFQGDTPTNIQRPHAQIASFPGPSDLSTINHEAAASSNNEVVISQLLKLESGHRQSNDIQTEQPLQERIESEKSLATMILKEAKDSEPSVREGEILSTSALPRADIQPQPRSVSPKIMETSSANVQPPTSNQSFLSHVGLGLQSHIDWAYTPLCINMLNKKTDWNSNMDNRIFVKSEVEFAVEMIRSKFSDYKRTDMMTPFHTKAMETLLSLLQEQGLNQICQKFQAMYREITIENTLKLLLRCKLLFHARKVFLEIFQQILVYEMQLRDVKKCLEEQTSYKLPAKELNELKLQAGRVYEAGEKVIMMIKQLRTDKKGHYSQPFIFKKKDLVAQIKNEVAEVRQIVNIFRQKRRDNSEDSEKQGRFIVESEDEVSEAEAIRDSNYAGSDLYWEQRFYQVKPKPPGMECKEENEQESHSEEEAN